MEGKPVRQPCDGAARRDGRAGRYSLDRLESLELLILARLAGAIMGVLANQLRQGGWHWQAAGTDLQIRERLFGGQPVLRRRGAGTTVPSATGRSSRGTHWLDDVVEFLESKSGFVVLPVPPSFGVLESSKG